MNANQLISLNNTVEDGDILHALESFIDAYKEQYQKDQQKAIPLILFADRKLSSLEVAVKYLKENLSLHYHQIASLLHRNQRTIWATYQQSLHKRKEPFLLHDYGYTIPCTAFVDRTRGPLEAVVIYLKDDIGLSFKQIAVSLSRDYNTIWLSYRNGKKHD